ncbi:hypothetical protein [Mucilaginibacter sp.]
MKKQTLLLLVILCCMSAKSFGQKLEENKVDDFTKSAIKRTSWESLYSTMNGNAHFRFSLVNNSETFDFRLMRDKVFSIDKDMQIMFKLDNGDIVTLNNLEFTVTCNGCGATGFVGSQAEGIDVRYPISKEQVEKLKAGKIVKVRVYTGDGYIDQDIKDKIAEKVTASLNLL